MRLLKAARTILSGGDSIPIVEHAVEGTLEREQLRAQLR
jgi:hypothetical protein